MMKFSAEVQAGRVNKDNGLPYLWTRYPDEVWNEASLPERMAYSGQPWLRVLIKIEMDFTHESNAGK